MSAFNSPLVFQVGVLLLFVLGGTLLGYGLMQYFQEKAKAAAAVLARKTAEAQAYDCDRQLEQMSRLLRSRKLSEAESKRYNALVRRQMKLQEVLQEPLAT